MMAGNRPSDKSPSAKQEPADDGKAAATAAARARAGSRSWPGLKDPRIVRVSRAFGGKDRHSKVSTVRGLRDRRVRLSVQTAIQLYDLQDRLGLSQPSKVVDWLLDAAQHEIDKLPPLQMPPGSCFVQLPHPGAAVASHGLLGLPRLTRAPLASAMAAASDIEQMGDTGAGSLALLPGRDGDRDHVQHQAALSRDDQHLGVEVIPVHGNLHRLGFLSMTGSGGGGSGSNPYASYCLLQEAPNLLAQPHLGGYSTTQAEEPPPHGYRPADPPTPSLSLSHASQLLLCPSGAAAPSMFSPYAAASADYEPKNANSSNSTVFQLLGSSASSQSSKHRHQLFWNGQESG